MAEYRLFDPADPPPWLDPEWWRNMPNCDHLAHPAGVHNARIVRTAQVAYDTAYTNRLEEIVDIGAGDAAVLDLLNCSVMNTVNAGVYRRPRLCGYEIITASRVAAAVNRNFPAVWEANVTKEAAEGLRTRFTTHLTPGTRDKRLTIATELFEHLADPHAMVRWLSTRTQWLVASSPWVETPEHHEDNHAWAWDRIGYRALFEDNGFHVVDHQDVEWSQIIVACR